MKTLGIVGEAFFGECECGELVQVVRMRRVGFDRRSKGWVDRFAPHDCKVKRYYQRLAKSMSDLFDADDYLRGGR